MGLFTKDIKTLEDLYKHGLRDIYYAENQIAKSLPAMIENAGKGELKRGLQQHLRETQEQVKRLEQVFKLHEEEPSGDKCPAIDGILKEGDDMMGEVEDKDVLDVGIVAAAQAVEHYEITRYGALIAWAKELGHRQDIPLLARNLEEEKATDKRLTAMAEGRVNPGAEGRGAKAKSAARGRKSGPGRAAASRRPPMQKRKAQRKKSARRKS